MRNLEIMLIDLLNDSFIDMVISGKKSQSEIVKIKVRPVALKGTLMYQATCYVGKQVIHQNLETKELVNKVLGWMQEEFKQIQIRTTDALITGLVSKKGKVTLKKKSVQMEKSHNASHNREKEYIIQEGQPVDFLVELGVMTGEGKVVKKRYDKFRQINRYLEFMKDILPALEAGRELTIIDFGCGKSYLTFAAYYYLCCLNEYKVRMIGLDLKKDVIEHCNQLKDRFGYDGLEFICGDIETFEGLEHVDMVISLHACDTATDYALYKAVKWGAKVIMAVPCCHHELNGQIQSEVLVPVFKYGLLKERIAALMTDGLRAALLSGAGYQTQVMEFIDMEHTPKNILIRAVKGTETKGFRPGEDYAACRDFIHASPALESLLRELDRSEY